MTWVIRTFVYNHRNGWQYKSITATLKTTDRALRVFFFFGLLQVSIFPGRIFAQAIDPLHLKAAIILNLIKFVDWPSEAFATHPKEIVVGVLGNHPIGKVLGKMSGGERLADREIVIKTGNSWSDFKEFQVVFVGESEREHWSVYEKTIKAYPILTVSDIGNFVDLGGMVGLLLVDRKIKLALNSDTLAQANLRISSKIMALATVVHEKNRSEGLTRP